MFYYNHFDNVAKGFGDDSGFTKAIAQFFAKKENRDIWIQNIEDLVWKTEHPTTIEQSIQLDAVHFKLTHYN